MNDLFIEELQELRGKIDTLISLRKEEIKPFDLGKDKSLRPFIDAFKIPIVVNLTQHLSNGGLPPSLSGLYNELLQDPEVKKFFSATTKEITGQDVKAEVREVTEKDLQLPAPVVEETQTEEPLTEAFKARIVRVIDDRNKIIEELKKENLYEYFTEAQLDSLVGVEGLLNKNERGFYEIDLSDGATYIISINIIQEDL
jgi:hypothetical protein